MKSIYVTGMSLFNHIAELELTIFFQRCLPHIGSFGGQSHYGLFHKAFEALLHALELASIKKVFHDVVSFSKNFTEN